MPRSNDDESSWDAYEEDEFEPSSNASDDLGEPTEPCAYCGRDVLEDAPRCPYCGNYRSREDAPVARKPWWVVVGVVAGLYVVYRWLLG